MAIFTTTFMTTFIITLFITFVILIGAAALIQICKYRPKSGNHQLTGMCHRQGGTVCCSCSDLESKQNSTK